VKTLLERLTCEGPKCILALDGGGVRGAITLGFLERIEQILRTRYQKGDVRLCDYFDLIGGTSTGAIIAAGLAVGMEAAEIKQKFLDLGRKVFGKKQWRKYKALYHVEPLKKELTTLFGDRTLGDPSIKTGLCIITKRADRRNTWYLINHPLGKDYDHMSPLLLADAVRASTAAPIYFIPVRFDLGHGEVGAFVDGAVSMAGNPALDLFLVATLSGFPFRWPIGEERLLLVSVGSGVLRWRSTVDHVVDHRLWDWAIEIPSILMEDASWRNQLLLQLLSRSPTPWEIDPDVGNLASDLLAGEPALSYLRYNVLLDADNLEQLQLTELIPHLESFRNISAAENSSALAAIGERAAEKVVQDEHFLGAFDKIFA